MSYSKHCETDYRDVDHNNSNYTQKKSLSKYFPDFDHVLLFQVGSMSL